MIRRSWPWLLVAVALALSASVAFAGGATYQLLPRTQLRNATLTNGNQSSVYSMAFNVPPKMHLTMLALKVEVASSGLSDSLQRVGIEVFPMTAVGSVMADSTTLGYDKNGKALGIRYIIPDSMAFGPIDLDDSNTKVDGFFCTTIDSLALATRGYLVLKDSTWTTGASNFDSSNALGQRGNWRQLVSSRVIYSEYLSRGKVGIGPYNAKAPGMAAIRPINASTLMTPVPLPGGPTVRADADAAPYTWFYMPMNDAYGGFVEVNRLMCTLLNRTTGTYYVSLYAICSDN
jgi:hypothetical protein